MNWKPDQWAILGLGPKSDFVKYLRNNSEGNVYIDLSSELIKSDGPNFDAKTTITINPKMDGLKKYYSDSFNHLREWRIKGQYTIGDQKGFYSDFCFVQYDNNIMSMSRGTRRYIRNMIFQKLCGDVQCEKGQGDLKKLPNLKL